MISQEPRNLSSQEVRSALGSRFKQVRMAQGKSALSLAQMAGITEFELSMIEQGVHESLTHEVVEKIAFNLGLAPKPSEMPKLKTKELEQVTNKRKNSPRGSTLTEQERADREKQGREIRALRLKYNIPASHVERVLKISLNSLSQMELKGTGLYPGRKKTIMAAIESLALDLSARPNGAKAEAVPRRIDISETPFNKPKQKNGFVVSTEHKLVCGDYELLASVSGDEFALTIANKKELMILEGAKKDKSGMLAALKHIIAVIEG